MGTQPIYPFQLDDDDDFAQSRYSTLYQSSSLIFSNLIMVRKILTPCLASAIHQMAFWEAMNIASISLVACTDFLKQCSLSFCYLWNHSLNKICKKHLTVDSQRKRFNIQKWASAHFWWLGLSSKFKADDTPKKSFQSNVVWSRGCGFFLGWIKYCSMNNVSFKSKNRKKHIMIFDISLRNDDCWI